MSSHGATRYAEPRTALLTVNELAALLGISRDSVYRLVKAGDVIGYRVGERLRFRWEDVDAYLDRHREAIS
jgi:excisionase family DNA binding protein